MDRRRLAQGNEAAGRWAGGCKQEDERKVLTMVNVMRAASRKLLRAQVGVGCRLQALREEGQGTVEYAILVGVLAVIAILAITLFKDKIELLWESIEDAINNV